MRPVILAFVLILLSGCSHPRPGDVYTIVNGASLYSDLADFRDEVDRESAGTQTSLDEAIRQIVDRRLVILPNGARIHVLERVPGGFKVVVSGGKHDGAIGWITEREIRTNGSPAQ